MHSFLNHLCELTYAKTRFWYGVFFEEPLLALVIAEASFTDNVQLCCIDLSYLTGYKNVILI